MRNFKFDRLKYRYDSLDESAANNEASTATNTGNNAISSYDPTAAGNTSSADVTGNFNTAQGQNSQAVQPLQNVINSNPTVTSLYQTGNQMYNVPALQTEATNLTNKVTNATPDNYTGARGYDINNTSVNNGIANETAYLTPQANAATANANTAAGLASNFVNAGIQQNAQNLIPAQENATLTQQNQATEGQGWNAAQAATLQGLITKMQSGVQLSATEMSQATALAQAEEQYQATLSTNQAGITESQIGNQYHTLNPTQQLYQTTVGSPATELASNSNTLPSGANLSYAA